VGSDDVRLSSLTVRSDVPTSTRAEVAVTLNTVTQIVAISDVAITNAGLQTAICKVGDAEPFSVSILQEGSTLWVHLPHGTVTLTSSASVKRRAADQSSGYSVVEAHFPGKVTSLAACVGLRVTIGDVPAVLDSMKMERKAQFAHTSIESNRSVTTLTANN
jgi:acetyl/propionyl-CoA carboxylase alpha subunit